MLGTEEDDETGGFGPLSDSIAERCSDPGRKGAFVERLGDFLGIADDFLESLGGLSCRCLVQTGRRIS